ncbi:hypothetical protein FNF29_01477 [Cafeteria roenbergensis]|uniref:GST N-terminal domain-containing protein n=1 Tax=Cafeteria roenbergensis TaxID=33653 RepID=A0A5A8DIX7_CAFRO|nr:hypothetical protein FNF31_06536 [Cafeteria roenbergensis]KAA0156061.1 hypothetical protein FNF29_01477 [Cafeteria roenbergensis]KAA0164594.1 hypothetical protein FNF28_03753 [Cafeteria roenbergensis]|eukprot:KAA0156061.1 hypothetical protein FNF29_01477 [Cafeteria roenbergensis]
MAASTATKLTLVNNPVCPFGARAHIAAAEHLKEGDYEVRVASLSDKPQWFTDIYRKAIGSDQTSTGKVPVMQDGDTVLCESAIVAEYIDRKFAADEGSRLLSDDPLKRAEAQLFVEQFGSRVVGGFYKMLWAPAGEKRDAALAAYTETMKDLDEALRAKDARSGTAGPFFDGVRFGWVEVMLFPWLARRSALSVHRGWELPSGAGFERVNAWVAACTARPSVVANTTPGDYYAAQYKSYAEKGDAATA